MRKKLSNELTLDELNKMRENGMTNRDIAESLGVSISTIYRYIGPQPSSLRGRHCDFESPSLPEKRAETHDEGEAALIVEDRIIGLVGLFASYRVNIRAKEVVVRIEDGVDALVVPFDDVENFAKEIRAISNHIKDIRVGAEAW